MMRRTFFLPILTILAASCATTDDQGREAGGRTDISPQREMTFAEARQIVRRIMTDSPFGQHAERIGSDRLTFRWVGEPCEMVYTMSDIQLRRYSFGDIRASVFVTSPFRCSKNTPSALQLLRCHSERVAQCEQLHQALVYLQERARRQARAGNAASDAAFSETAARYRAADPKPPFPQEARRLRVQAEAAVRDKEFEEAADFYEQALRLAPWWPEGRFNRALILGELKEYGEAMVEMKRYLMLVPDAPNAAAAQDKIYEWEGKAARPR